jgi:hypothetical protein
MPLRPRWLPLALASLLVACSAAPPPLPVGDLRPDAAPRDMEGLAVLAGYWVIHGVRGEPSPAPARASYYHEGSATCMPRALGPFTPRREQVYGPDDASVSLWNEQTQTLVTLYTYPARGPTDAEFAGVMRDMAKTCGGKHMVSSHVADPRFPERGLVAACGHRVQGTMALEQALLFRRGPWFHKARVTYVQSTLERAYAPSMTLVQAAFNRCLPPGRSA